MESKEVDMAKYEVYVDLKEGEDFTVSVENKDDKLAAQQADALARKILKEGYEGTGASGALVLIPASDVKKVSVTPFPRVSPSR